MPMPSEPGLLAELVHDPATGMLASSATDTDDGVPGVSVFEVKPSATSRVARPLGVIAQEQQEIIC